MRNEREFEVIYKFADGTVIKAIDFRPEMLTEQQQKFIAECLSG